MNLRSRLQRVERQCEKSLDSLSDEELDRFLLAELQRWEREHGPITPKEANVHSRKEFYRLSEIEQMAAAKAALIRDGIWPQETAA